MKNAQVHPYIFFGGSCEEALNFYKSAIGAEIGMLMRFKESPDPHPPGMVPPGWENKIMHANLRIGQSELMASDGCGDSKFNGFSLSIAVTDKADAERIFGALSQGGEVEMPLMPTFWSPCFGMLKDKFGMGWMISVVGQPS